MRVFFHSFMILIFKTTIIDFFPQKSYSNKRATELKINEHVFFYLKKYDRG
jgi:hypothetical protein